MDEVSNLSNAQNVSQFGGKAVSLASMLRGGLPVPTGFAISLDAFDEDGKIKPAVSERIIKLLNPKALYAVRSSAIAEDGANASWAGQFESFLNIVATNVPTKVEECHNSAKARAKAYAQNLQDDSLSEVAVVIQEMIQPEYAGVLFTKDPLTGEDRLTTEYVEGLGEALVSGQADPMRISWKPGDKPDAPFDIAQLTDLAQKAEALFGTPQDIEWVWAKGKMWFVQARPITVTQETGDGYYIGEPDELFYWGPSRTIPVLMSDFMAAAEQFFVNMHSNPAMPNPPRTLALFHEDKVVWLSNAQAFAAFTEATFKAYASQDRFDKDHQKWTSAKDRLKQADAPKLVEAWSHTLFAEFSLYGAEVTIAKMLNRLDPKDRQKVWGAYAYPDQPTFLNQIDLELYQSKDAKRLAEKYPWVEDGYGGVANSADDYFTKRLAILKDNPPGVHRVPDRKQVAREYSLSQKEIAVLDLARKLAQFIDERKAWMMMTRRNIHTPATDIEHGWFYDDGKTKRMSKAEVADFWERYVDFKASTSAVKGTVASNGSRHFINGEVRVLSGPTDSVEDGMVLVVPSTSPSYVPLMRKARALITDHGGMMSHAAIVGREFNLPCIVGTKQATKVLKDGDKVVLDLVTGEIKR